MDHDRREIEFLRTLGVGGFGAVYLANLHGRDRFVRRVAVKIMREGLDSTPDLVARQKDEARLLGLLAHDGIVQVLDLAEVEGRPAVVMEYVEGVDLSDVIKSMGAQRFPVRAALEIVASVASALDAAYNSVSALTGQPLRVIHRDIKPANMLLTPSGRVKVLDFGVAKADFARDGQTTNNLFGTPRFMAPEQWLGDPYGAPVDVYALGVTLFDLVADRPWERPPLGLATFQQKVGEQLAAQTDVPEDVLALIEGMTSFNPEDRPTPAQVREYAELALADAPGDSLARIARTLVPPLVEAKNQRTANEPVPGPVSLGTVSPPRGSPVADVEASMVTSSRGPVPVAVWGALAAGVGGMLLLAVGLAGFAWVLSDPGASSAEEAALTEAAGEAPPGEGAPAQVVETQPTGEAPAEPTAGADEMLGQGADAVEAPAEVVAGSEPEAAGAEPAAGREPVAAAALTGASSGAKRPVGPRSTTTGSATRSAPASGETTAVKAPASAAAEQAAARHPLSVISIPGSAEVWIDGKKVGETPLVSYALPAGPHEVWLVLEGTRSAKTTVAVAADQAPKVRYDFSKTEWRSVK